MPMEIRLLSVPRIVSELPNTKLHSILLDHEEIKLTWYIDWPKKEVLFNVDEAFQEHTKWFSFGFSQRGELEKSDICFFVRHQSDDDLFNGAIVSQCVCVLHLF